MSYDMSAKVEIQFLQETGRIVTVVFTRQAIGDLMGQALDQNAFNFTAALDHLGVKKYKVDPETKFWRVFDEWNRPWKNSLISDDDMETAFVVGVMTGGEIGLNLFNSLIETCGVEIPVEVEQC